MLTLRLLRSIIRTGSLRVIDSTGRHHVLGDGTGSACTIRFGTRRLDHTLALHPGLLVGEAYMEGHLSIEEGTLYDFLEIGAKNYANVENNPWFRLITRIGWLPSRYNSIAKARHNVAHHYDLSDRLYDLFLDSDRQYSCAYFASASDSLEAAQERKKRHIAAKLLLDRPGLKILDIGSGWGGLGLYLARETGADVTGITLSIEQLEASQRRAAASGLADRARFHLRDYRHEAGTYDRIVSVGMFEHVGVPQYRAFFRKLKHQLADDGVALLHSIGRSDSPGSSNPWISKYIFPGAYAPALSEVMQAVQDVGLWITDIEILRLHYAETLRQWRRNFEANRDAVRKLYDERFCRMWEFYLTSCEVGFRHASQMVFQMQLAKRSDAVPLRRDYIVDWESAQASIDQPRRVRP